MDSLRIHHRKLISAYSTLQLKRYVKTELIQSNLIVLNFYQLLFSTTGLDEPLKAGINLAKPLLFEVKSVKNVSKPFQRVKDPDLGDIEPKMQNIGPKKG